ncbi:MAG: ZIP family metal transporter [Desulfurococcaceae archaeon]
MQFESLIAENYLIRAFIYGLIPALSTSIGGLLGLLGLKASEKWLDFGLSLSAGIMLATSLYELLPEGISKSGYLIALLGFVMGVLIIGLIERIIPHEHIFKGYEGSPVAKTRLRAVSLSILAIIIHNIPEGMAVGAASYMGVEIGLATAASIAIQDIPEGYAVSFPLSLISRKKARPLIIAVLSGLSETLMAVFTALITKIIAIEGFILGLVSGAMFYIISHEVIPETHRYGYETLATIGFIKGFILSIIIMELI